MKKAFLFIFIVFVMGALYGFNLVRDKTFEVNDNFYTRGYFNKTPNYNKNKLIVLLGDSLTQGIASYEKFNGYNILNKGVSGNTTEDILKRTNQILALKPEKLFIMAGTNDVWTGIEIDKTMENYLSIIDSTRKALPNCEIYMLSTMPFGKVALENNPKASNAKVDMINKKLKLLSFKKNIFYLEIAGMYKDYRGFLNKRYSNDGIHLIPEYYSMWVKEIKKNF